VAALQSAQRRGLGCRYFHGRKHRAAPDCSAHQSPNAAVVEAGQWSMAGRIRTAIINLEPARAACHPWGPERRRRASDLTRRSQRLAARVRGSRPTNIGRGRRVATRRPSVSTPATVPVRDSRPLRGRGRSRPLSGLRSARTVIAAGRRRRVRRFHASAATLACPDVEAQPTRPLVRRRHRATSSHLRSQADARTCYVPRPP